MDTSRFYLELLNNTPATAPEQLLRAIWEHCENVPDSELLSRELVSRADIPVDVLIHAARHGGTPLRVAALLNPALPEKDALAVVNKIGLGAIKRVARYSKRPAVLAKIAQRPLSGELGVALTNELLANVHLPADALGDFIVRLEGLMQTDTAFGVDENLLGSISDALLTSPGLGNELLTRLRDPQVIVKAAKSPNVDPDGWAHVLEVVIEPARAIVTSGQGATLTYGTRRALTELTCWSPTDPDRLAAAQPVLRGAIEVLRAAASDPGQRRDLDRRLLRLERGTAARPDAAAADAAAAARRENLARAASPDRSVLLAVLEQPLLPTEVVVAIAANPAADRELILEAAARSDRTATTRAALFAAVTDVDTRAGLVLLFGPDAVAHLGPDRIEVLSQVLPVAFHLARTPAGAVTPATREASWWTVADTLTDADLRQLPWSVVRYLAGHTGPTAQTVAGWLGDLFVHPGAAHLFGQLEGRAEGTAENLLAALENATTADPVPALAAS